jgi:hypothetical protein
VKNERCVQIKIYGPPEMKKKKKEQCPANAIHHMKQLILQQ